MMDSQSIALVGAGDVLFHSLADEWVD